MVRRAVDNSELERWRQVDSAKLLGLLADHAKQDVTFRPRATTGATRWHIRVAGAEFEVLCTGPKFMDTRAAVGGGGAVDLAMHLFQVDFIAAVRLLRERGV